MSKNDKSRNTVVSFLKTACCIFTPVIILIYTIGNFSSEGRTFIPTFGTVCIIFAFSFIISVASALYGKISFAAAHSINFVVIGIAYYLAIIVLRGKSSDGIQTLIAMTLYVILFAIATILITVLKGKKKKLINDIKPYDSRF